MPLMILRQQADRPRACNASHIYIFKGKKGQQSWMELAGVEKVQFKTSQSSLRKYNSGLADVDGALFQFRGAHQYWVFLFAAVADDGDFVDDANDGHDDHKNRKTYRELVIAATADQQE